MKQAKQWLKDNSIKIRELKDIYKNEQRANFGCPTYNTIVKLGGLQREYRHRHIAYSELKGNKRHLIEIPRENNKPNENLICDYKVEILERIKRNEDVCSS
jgi:hypothetical protein